MNKMKRKFRSSTKLLCCTMTVCSAICLGTIVGLIFFFLGMVPKPIVEQLNEKTISHYVIVNGLTATEISSFNQESFVLVTNGIGDILTLHPNDVVYVNSDNDPTMQRFNFSYQLDVETSSVDRLVGEITQKSYITSVEELFNRLANRVDLGVRSSDPVVTDFKPAATVNPDKLITQELVIDGLSVDQIKENEEEIIRQLAEKLGISPQDIEITGIEDMSRRRRLLSVVSRLTYVIKTNNRQYEKLLDEVESDDYRGNLVEELAEATGIPAVDLSVNSRKVVAEDYEEPLVCNTDCSILTNPCGTGICDNGACVTVPTNEQGACNDDNICTHSDTCISGICVGIDVDCYDNNPCTIDKCVAGVGCMEQQQEIEGTCIPGCVQDKDCPPGFLCHDGTCLNIDFNEILFIRFINYEIQDCDDFDGIGHRLLLSFIMDAEKHLVGTDYMYRVAASKDDFSASRQPLGFIDKVLDLNVLALDDTARSAFTLSTGCQEITKENCNAIFVDRRYEFDIAVKDCEDINVFPPSGCLDPKSHVSAHVSVSLSDCSMFDGDTQELKIYGEAQFVYNGNTYAGLKPSNQFVRTDSKAIVGIRTDLLNHTRYRSVLTNVRACMADPLHRTKSCVDQTNTSECFNVGCYNWSPFDSPLRMKWDFMESGYKTALSMSTFNIQTCYPSNIYHAVKEEMCQVEKCTKYPGLDDGFEIDFAILPKGTIVFDLVYDYVDCEGNALESDKQVHHMVSVKIL